MVVGGNSLLNGFCDRLNIDLSSKIPPVCWPAAAATVTGSFVHLSHHSSVHPYVTWVDQSKTVQARITKFSPSAAQKALVSGSPKLFHKFERGHRHRGC